MSRLLFAALVVALAHPAHADFKLRLSYPAVVGTWTQGANLNGVDSTNSRFMQYVPNDASTTNWQHWAGSFANGGGRRNQVMRFGWNLAGGGGRVTTGANNGALGSEYEQYYESAGNHMERHEVYVDPTGRLTRWLSFDGRLDTPYTTKLYVFADQLILGIGASSADRGVLTADATTTSVFSPNLFQKAFFDNTQVMIQAGTTSTATASLQLVPAGDVQVKSTRGYLGGVSTGVRFDWTATAADIFSPDANTNLYVANGDMQFIVGGTQSLRLSSSVATLGANMSIASGFDIAAAGGASDFDYSLSSGIFKTPTGVATFNGSGNDFTAIVRSTMDAVASLGDSTRRWASGWFGTNAVGTTQLAAITAANNVAATVGAQKFSPMIELDGAGWKTDATAASRTVRAAMQVRPVQGTAAPESELVFWKSVDTGTPSWLEMFSVSEQFGDRDQIKSGRNKALFSASDDSGVYVDGAEPSVNLRTSGFVRAAMTPSAFRPGNDLSASLGDSTTAWANVYTRHIVGAGAAPTFTAGAGLGTAPTVTVTGTDIAYKIAITTGTSVPAGASTWGTLNYNTAYAVKPKAVMCMPGDVNAGAYWGTSGIYVDDATSSTTVNTLKVATTALNNTTDYILNCQVIQ